jgi:F-type H+-transporting ATPase subunit b
MELVTPGIGLIFWMTLSFGIVLFVLRKFAWGPILGTIRERENFISNSIRDSKRVQRELAQLDETKERIMNQAREDAADVVKRAKGEAEILIRKAQDNAREEAQKIMDATKNMIVAERKAAEREIRQQIILLSMDLAQSVMEVEFKDKENKNKYISKLLDDIKLN